MIIYIIWCLSLIIHLFSCYKFREHLYKIELLSVVPVVSFIIFTYVFVINSGSNVAQFSYSTDLWKIWFNFYLPLYLSLVINFIYAFVLFVIYIVRKKGKYKIYNILQSVIITIISMYHVIPQMPDA